MGKLARQCMHIAMFLMLYCTSAPPRSVETLIAQSRTLSNIE